MLRKIVEIVKREQLNKDYFIISIKDKEMADLTKAGQFYELTPVNNRINLLRKPISVYNVKEDCVEFLVKIIGEGTRRLSELMQNDRVDLVGPLGNNFNIEKDKNALLISGGIGVAPLYQLKKDLLAQNNTVEWIHGGRTETDIVIDTDLTYTDDGSKGKKGYVVSDLEDILENGSFDIIYCCGPEIMMEKCVEIANEYKVKVEVSMEAYMACGIGACKGCAIPVKSETEDFEYKLVCKNGPIFDGNEVMWHE